MTEMIYSTGIIIALGLSASVLLSAVATIANRLRSRMRERR